MKPCDLFATELNLSPTPVRDAALRLVRERVLYQPNARVFAVRKLTMIEFLELQKVRVRLEGLAASQAAQLITDQQLTEMSVLNERFLKLDDMKLASAMNAEFHLMLSRIAELPVVSEILESIWVQVGPLFLRLHEHMWAHGLLDEEHLHAHLIEALRQRNPEKSEQAIVNDINWGTCLVQEHNFLGKSRKT